MPTRRREDHEEDEGEATRKRQSPGPSVQSAAGSGEAPSRSILAPVGVTFSMRCSSSDVARGREGLEAALRNVVEEFGGFEFKLEGTDVGPSDDALQRILPVLLESTHYVTSLIRPRVSIQLYRTCKPWRRELEARGFCYKTMQLCLALAGKSEPADEDEEVANDRAINQPPLDISIFQRLSRNVLRRLSATADLAERASCVDANAFIQRSWGWTGTLHQWLQVASQEPDASFLSRGAASTARSLGLPLVQWLGRPQGRYPGQSTLSGHEAELTCVAISPDGKSIVSGSYDQLIKVWNTETATEVESLNPTVVTRS